MCSPKRKTWSPKSGNVEPKLAVCFLLLECNADLYVTLTSLLWLPFTAFSVFTDYQLRANNFEKVF